MTPKLKIDFLVKVCTDKNLLLSYFMDTIFFRVLLLLYFNMQFGLKVNFGDLKFFNQGSWAPARNFKAWVLGFIFCTKLLLLTFVLSLFK